MQTVSKSKNHRNWGGKRKGAGAKPQDPSVVKSCTYSFRLPSELYAQVKQRPVKEGDAIVLRRLIERGVRKLEDNSAIAVDSSLAGSCNFTLRVSRSLSERIEKLRQPSETDSSLIRRLVIIGLQIN